MQAGSSELARIVAAAQAGDRAAFAVLVARERAALVMSRLYEARQQLKRRLSHARA